MSVENVANQLVSLCRQGKFEEAVTELYSPNIVSIEPTPTGTKRDEGLEAYQAKGKGWQDSLEAFHGIEVSDPIVADKFFSCKMVLDVTMKGRPRSKDEEICVYQVKDGKIVSEQFFYSFPEG